MARLGEKLEQGPRCLAIQDSPTAAVLHNRLRIGCVVLEIGKANPVDAGRMAPDPAAPDEPRDVEQKRGVVGQESSSAHRVADSRHRQDR